MPQFLILVLFAVLLLSQLMVSNPAPNPAGGPIPSDALKTIADTIQQVEGYYPGTLAYRNNNPGNLRYAGQPGATGVDSHGFAIFTNYQAGYAALERQIQLYASRGLTIAEMMALYAPAGDGNNDPAVYASIIANNLGVSPDTMLTNLGVA